VIIKVCKEKLKINISEEEIDRSHTLGRINHNGKVSIICRFRGWKAKNKAYRAKSELIGNTNKILITEDLTIFRRRLISRLKNIRKQMKTSLF